ncbi:MULTISPECIES: hypothetical protein [unclassified Neisseria]|uniref:hypothetical protein n=1 Tax=unclassified Neisseria TaxID=2623750 RepID=UPI002665B091|nr:MULTISPECIES: hypothetical protein [unclassified Neisseria]MDO1509488.1 hypothetical protein [Neisseria sp. MVDL19-042950]MDO1515740.1 hypothetical protein [Neisseria sp. MVDL18-041461]MDO1563436.1 hypothetical protein [Neisseria sp. MVDL20-010259]
MSSKTDHIISEVFRLTSLRITKDDPVMAVLLMQQKMFDEAFAQLSSHQEQYAEAIAAHAENITAAAAKLETYREQLLIELAQQANNQIQGTENRVYASVSERVVRDVEAANAAFIDRLKKLLMFVSAAWGIGLLLLVGVVVFK